MRKRYIAAFNERSQGNVVIVERTDDGQAAWTVYPAKGAGIDKKREEYLLWPR